MFTSTGIIFGSKDLKEIIDKEKQMKIENLVFTGKVYNDGKAISQREYDILKTEGKLDVDTYYLIKPKTDVDTKLDATKKWCSLSNAIIKKYKNMVEFDDETLAIRQLNAIRILLEGNNFFIKEDFEDWGEE